MHFRQRRQSRRGSIKVPAQQTNRPRFAKASWALWFSLCIPAAVPLLYAGYRCVLGPPPGKVVLFGAAASAVSLFVILATYWSSHGRAIIESIGAKLSVLAWSMLFVLTLAEMGLRLSFYGSLNPVVPNPFAANKMAHPTRGWSLIPDKTVSLVTRDYAVVSTTNSAGLRDIEHQYEPQEGVYRIVILGDSFMEAYQVNLEESLPRLLAAELAGRKVEVINLGVGGYGTAQEYLYLKEEGLKYHPNLVILAYLIQNDTRNNSRELERLMWDDDGLKVVARPFASMDPETKELYFSPPDYDLTLQLMQRQPSSNRLTLLRLLENLPTRSTRKIPAYDPNIWLGAYLRDFDPKLGHSGLTKREYAELWDQAAETTFALLCAMRQLAGDHGADFLMFTVPGPVISDPNERAKISATYPSLVFDIEKQHPHLERLRSADVQVLDLIPHFQQAIARGEGPLHHKIEDFHWNAAGHRLATEVLAKYLLDQGWLDRHVE